MLVTMVCTFDRKGLSHHATNTNELKTKSNGPESGNIPT